MPAGSPLLGITHHTARQALAAATRPPARADTNPGVCTAMYRKLAEIQSSQRTQHQQKQNRYSLYRSLDSSIVLNYPDVETE